MAFCVLCACVFERKNNHEYQINVHLLSVELYLFQYRIDLSNGDLASDNGIGARDEQSVGHAGNRQRAAYRHPVDHRCSTPTAGIGRQMHRLAHSRDYEIGQGNRRHSARIR